MNTTDKQKAQIKRFLQWLGKGDHTVQEIEQAKQRLNQRTGLDVGDEVVKAYIKVVTRKLEELV